MNKTFRIVGLLLVMTLLAVGIVSAASRMADVSILPMPAVKEADKDSQPAMELTTEPVAEPASEGEAVPDSAVVPPGEAENNEAAAQPAPANTLALDEQPWTQDELAALRELARERIRAKAALDDLEQLHGDVTDYLRGLWRENVEPFFKDMESRRDKVANDEQLVEAFDRWMERMDLPKSDQMVAEWDKLVERFANSAGVAVDDAKVIGGEWIDQQAELLENVLEGIEDLRDELRSAWQEAATVDTSADASRA